MIHIKRTNVLFKTCKQTREHVNLFFNETQLQTYTINDKHLTIKVSELINDFIITSIRRKQQQNYIPQLSKTSEFYKIEKSDLTRTSLNVTLLFHFPQQIQLILHFMKQFRDFDWRWWWKRTAMFLAMEHQRRALGEMRVTDIALVRLLPNVQQQMNLLRSHRRKYFITYVAGKSFSLKMCLQVFGQSILASKLLAAMFAIELFVVSYHVAVEIRRSLELLVANSAFEILGHAFVLVIHVDVQGAFVGVQVTTNLAAVAIFFIVMILHVAQVVRLHFKHFPTNFANVTVVVGMLSDVMNLQVLFGLGLEIAEGATLPFWVLFVNHQMTSEIRLDLERS